MGSIRSVGVHIEAEARRAREKIKQNEKEAAVRKANPPYLAFMDIYFGCEGGHGRVTVVEGTLNYQPLGESMKTTARENSKILLEKIVKLFGNVYVDTRLENWHYKPSTIAGLNLNTLLELTDPSLKDLDPYDLASRVAFIAARPEHRPEALPAETLEKPADQAPDASAPRRNTRREFE
jgi:hypothetical protein